MMQARLVFMLRTVSLLLTILYHLLILVSLLFLPPSIALFVSSDGITLMSSARSALMDA
jgi:hypothetical protein